MSAKTLFVGLFAAMLVCLAAEAVVACPTCAEALASNNPNHTGMARGFQYSILFMMGMPFTLLGLFTMMMVREVRKARRTGHSEQPGVLRPTRNPLSNAPSLN